MNEENRGRRDVIWPVFDAYAAEGVLSNVSRYSCETMAILTTHRMQDHPRANRFNRTLGYD